LLEKTIKLAVHKRLKEVGAFQHWPVQMGMGDRCLDCHGCYQGVYFAIETKRPGATPTKIQWVTIENIQAAGGLVFVIDSLEAASALFSDHPPPIAEITRPLRPRLRVVARRADH
jgi:penicillin-binding protein-related factor A (putative recombinase)